MNSGKFPDPLQDYFDGLLSDPQPGVPSHFADEVKLAVAGNVAALSSAPRPARVVSSRPYAEPIRTLNLRMPLPPVAPADPPAPARVQIAESPPVESVTESRVAAKAPAAIPSERVVQPAPSESAAPVAPPAVAETPLSEAQRRFDLAAMAEPTPWLANGRPRWAQQPFECLIFKAGSLQLAAPLVELGSIYPLAADGLTELFGQTQWFMGLLPVKEYNVRAMDTALVVMPERYAATMRENYRYILTLFGSDWGLAVDAVVGTVVLDPERIRWRGQRGKRPWLAGTLIDEMCALFDIAQLAWLFHNQDRKRVPR